MAACVALERVTGIRKRLVPGHEAADDRNAVLDEALEVVDRPVRSRERHRLVARIRERADRPALGAGRRRAGLGGQQTEQGRRCRQGQRPFRDRLAACEPRRPRIASVHQSPYRP
jgi:hypothetical protein